MLAHFIGTMATGRPKRHSGVAAAPILSRSTASGPSRASLKCARLSTCAPVRRRAAANAHEVLPDRLRADHRTTLSFLIAVLPIARDGSAIPFLCRGSRMRLAGRSTQLIGRITSYLRISTHNRFALLKGSNVFEIGIGSRKTRQNEIDHTFRTTLTIAHDDSVNLLAPLL